MSSAIALPLATIIRAAQLDEEHALSKQAKVALQRAAATFIFHLSSAAGAVCADANRVAVNDKDVFRAIEDLELPGEFLEVLRASLLMRKARAQSRSVKRKVEE
jgi:histone H3/H4